MMSDYSGHSEKQGDTREIPNHDYRYVRHSRVYGSPILGLCGGIGTDERRTVYSQINWLGP